ncbi:MAG TPA: PP2C family serine/threonine-protein phosphatase [Burkholderiales bacterium]|nr:PP2C family serine/threonine-protein phosphatase [Burkholderiales bacterium]
MKYALVQDSRIGGRRMNQDRIGQWSTPESLLMVVADGMGGHIDGEVAAQTTVDILGRSFQNEARPRLAHPSAFLSRNIAASHVAIVREAQVRGLPEAPRTVVVACLVQDGHAYWAHTGDCRLYLFRKGRIHVRTKDHSVVQQLVDEGRIREEAVSSHPQRNRLLQCLGGLHAPRIDVGTERLAKDDVLLLCSDGLWGPLTQRQMLNAVLTQPLDEAVASLVALAEARAGRDCDNTSVVAMTWGEEMVRLEEDGPRTVPYEELRTDVQDFTATDLEFLRMTDEDVERAIADIKAALRKNAPGS